MQIVNVSFLVRHTFFFFFRYKEPRLSLQSAGGAEAKKREKLCRKKKKYCTFILSSVFTQSFVFFFLRGKGHSLEKNVIYR